MAPGTAVQVTTPENPGAPTAGALVMVTPLGAAVLTTTVSEAQRVVLHCPSALT